MIHHTTQRSIWTTILTGRYLLLAWFSMGCLLAAEPIAFDSRVSRVTVYPEWAYVTRSGAVALEAGLNRVVLAALPAWIDDESLKVALDAPGNFVITAANTQTVYLHQFDEAEVRQAKDAVTDLRDHIEDLQTQINVLAMEQRYLENLVIWKADKIPHESAARKVDPDELRAVGAFMSEQLLGNLNQQNVLRRKLRDIEPELTVKTRKWEQLQSRARLEQKTVTVEIECPEASAGQLSISYLISGASWYPTYDARTDAAKTKLAFGCSAIVQQSTGEDWSDAAFTLSTIQPYLVREKPTLAPWFLETVRDLANQTEQSFSSVRFAQGAQIRMAKIQRKQEVYNDFNPDAYANLQDNVANAREVVRQVEERGMTVEHDVQGRFSVKTDGRPVPMLIGTAELAPTRRYTAVPAASASTYLTGDMRNTGSMPFLPGPVKVYVGGSLVGKSRINSVAEGEKFELYLGLEERIKATREINKSQSRSSLFGDRKRLSVGYDIELKNFLDQPATVDVSDQIPVSQDDSVKVRLMDSDPRPEGKSEKGILNWRITLEPGQTKTVHFEFQVDYPANTELGNAKELVRQIDFAL